MIHPEQLTTYTLGEHLDIPDEQVRHLIDIDSVPVPQRRDYIRRNANITDGRVLCGDCDGTGNQHFWSYKQCATCAGKGYSAS